VTTKLIGRHNWSLSKGDDYHRTYTLTNLVSAALTDGPYTVANTSGLPTPRVSTWSQSGETDSNAVCLPGLDAEIYSYKPGEASITWKVKQKFSTNVPKLGPSTAAVNNPLLFTTQTSGGTSSETVQAYYDLDEKIIQSSSQESLLGPETSYREGRPTVHLLQHTALLGLGLASSMVFKVNSTPMWGLAKRKIKLENFGWSIKYFGVSSKYYERRFDFIINYDTWDREIPDKGTKALGNRDKDKKWVVPANPDPTKQGKFNRYTDENGNHTTCFLNGKGEPADGEATAAKITIKKHSEINFFTLGGIPATLG